MCHPVCKKTIQILLHVKQNIKILANETMLSTVMHATKTANMQLLHMKQKFVIILIGGKTSDIKIQNGGEEPTTYNRPEKQLNL